MSKTKAMTKQPILMMRSAFGRLAPADAHSEEAIKKLAFETTYQVEFHRARNPANHRRFFALVNLVAERHPVYSTVNKALTAIKIAAGHVDLIPSPVTGELVAVPKSISFAEMDNEEEFRAFFEEAVSGVLTHLLPDFAMEDIDRMFDEIARF